MPRRITYNATTGCDERRDRKTGELLSQYRLWPVADPSSGPPIARPMTKEGGGDLANKIAASPPGMAAWAGTGPEGETCGHCRLFTASRYLRGECRQYVQLRKAQGERKPKPIGFSAHTSACRYFEPDRNARTRD